MITYLVTKTNKRGYDEFTLGKFESKEKAVKFAIDYFNGLCSQDLKNTATLEVNGFEDYDEEDYKDPIESYDVLEAFNLFAKYEDEKIEQIKTDFEQLEGSLLGLTCALENEMIYKLATEDVDKVKLEIDSLIDENQERELRIAECLKSN